MNAQRWSGCGLAFVMAVVLLPAVRADDGLPSRATLEDMGLGGMIVVSDVVALSVRGHGYQGRGKSSVRVFGNSFATINTKKGTAHSKNGYVASGKHFAAGKNFSFAGATFKKSKGHGGYGGNSHSRPGMGGGHRGGFKSVKVFAGGFSAAVAF